MSEAGAAAPTPIRTRDNKHTREHLLSKACKSEMEHITDFGSRPKSVISHLWQRRMVVLMRSRSESVMAVPEGRQRPRLTESSATSPPTTLALYMLLASLALLFSSVQRPEYSIKNLSGFSCASFFALQ